MHIIFSNYGNHGLALLQWAREQALPQVTSVSVESGFADSAWLERVANAEAYAAQCEFQTVRLKSKVSFAELVRDRKEFPTTKFQWCAGFLKGLPLLEWLDKVDPSCQATIMLGKRREDARVNYKLPEFITESEHYGGRKVWYPLYQCGDAEFIALISRAGFSLLPHRSLECDPCVNSGEADFKRLRPESAARLQALETEIGKTMFTKPIAEMLDSVKNSQPQREHELKLMDMFYMGCGSPYGCGE